MTDTDRTLQADLNGSDPDATVPADLGATGADADATLAADLGSDDADATIQTDLAGQAETPPRSGTGRRKRGPKLLDDAQLAKEIDAYEIIDFLGEGGMGTVFRARHKDLGRVTALKVIELGEGKEEIADQFMREARLAATVEHPNLVTLYDFGEVDNLLFMALRYIDGGDVDGKIKREGVISDRDALNIMLDCTRALEAIYRAGMVHRDIKPGNIFLDEQHVAYIGDLGLATLVSETADEEGGFAGTPAFTSPEQAQGQDLDIRTDIYSLGAVYFVMATGAKPYEGATPFEVLGKVISAPTPDPRQVLPTVSDEVAAVIMRAMAKDREQRYSAPTEMLQDLMAIMERRPLVNTRTSMVGEQPQPKTERYSAAEEDEARKQAERERRVTVLRSSSINLQPAPVKKPETESFVKRLFRGIFGR